MSAGIFIKTFLVAKKAEAVHIGPILIYLDTNSFCISKQNHANEVDGKQVPVPHFGVVLAWEKFHEFSKHLQAKDVQFIIEPYIRFEGEVGEQATLFFLDPSGNALEFKAFKDPKQLFAK